MSWPPYTVVMVRQTLQHRAFVVVSELAIAKVCL